jgi:arsenate reductase
MLQLNFKSSKAEMNREAITLQPSLLLTINELIKQFDQISSERKFVLGSLVQFIGSRNDDVYLNFICTHNSRRSHISQLWAQAAAAFYQVPNVRCFSGGSEATSFNPRAIKAMQDAGFKITLVEEGTNPVYEVYYSDKVDPIIAFSKKYDDGVNPTSNFAAVMTCSQADERCPVVKGAVSRISITYDDPKEFDDTLREAEKYKERVMQIGREMLYMFSKVKTYK